MFQKRAEGKRGNHEQTEARCLDQVLRPVMSQGIRHAPLDAKANWNDAVNERAIKKFKAFKSFKTLRDGNK
jgi:hypothetical protein